MQNKMKIAILGGDDRQIFQAAELKRLGWACDLWGLGEGADTVGDWKDAARGARAILLPLPASEDGVRIRSPRASNACLRFSALLSFLEKDAYIWGGRIPPIWQIFAAERGIQIVDYYEFDALQMKNAVPTVEGAILYALRELPVTLDGSSVAVIGYGRVASLLAERLLALGASVTVYARKERDLLHASLRHMRSVRILGEGADSTLCSIPPDCRMIFNTVPQRIFTEEILCRLPKSCMLMELASPPGGFDPALAEFKGVRCILAPALPGKCFPESAGRILAEVLSEHLSALFSNDSEQSERNDEG